MRLARGVLVAIGLLAVGWAPASARAAVIGTFTTRAAFDAATSSTQMEDFNEFRADLAFHTTPVDVGPFTLSLGIFESSIQRDSNRNKIDVPPVAFPVFNVDGSPIVNVLTSWTGDSIRLTFDEPITAFGADFANMNTPVSFAPGIARTHIFLDGVDSVVPPNTVESEVRFFGFVTDLPFTELAFDAPNTNVSNGFGMDNVSFGFGAPEPSTALLLGCGLLCASRRRRAPTRWQGRGGLPVAWPTHSGLT